MDGHFSVNHEHPVFVKSLFALSNMFLRNRFGAFVIFLTLDKEYPADERRMFVAISAAGRP